MLPAHIQTVVVRQLSNLSRRVAPFIFRKCARQTSQGQRSVHDVRNNLLCNHARYETRGGDKHGQCKLWRVRRAGQAAALAISLTVVQPRRYRAASICLRRDTSLWFYETDTSRHKTFQGKNSPIVLPWRAYKTPQLGYGGLERRRSVRRSLASFVAWPLLNGLPACGLCSGTRPR